MTGRKRRQPSHVYAVHVFSLLLAHFFFLLIRRPPRSTLFPYRRSSDLEHLDDQRGAPEERHVEARYAVRDRVARRSDRKSTRLNSSHTVTSYAVFCLKKKIAVCGFLSVGLYPFRRSTDASTVNAPKPDA